MLGALPDTIKMPVNGYGVLNSGKEFDGSCGTAKNRVLEWRSRVAVCQNMLSPWTFGKSHCRARRATQNCTENHKDQTVKEHHL